MLIFFGFTNCPDVCPTTLAEITAIMDDLGSKADNLQPIYISVDPERDNPAAVASYVSLFHPKIIGLTGTPQQIAEIKNSFPVYFEQIKDATALDGYTIGHTSHLFLFDPNAGFVDSWSYGTGAEEIVFDLKGRI